MVRSYVNVKAGFYVMFIVNSGMVHPPEPCCVCGKKASSMWRVATRQYGQELWSDYCDDHAPLMALGHQYLGVPITERKG